MLDLLLVAAAITVPAKPILIQSAGNDSFFAHPEIRALLLRNGFDVRATASGSGRIADLDLSRYDLALPAGRYFADLIEAKLPTTVEAIPVFSTTVVVQTWKPLLPRLAALGLATRESDDTWTFHVDKYLELVTTDVTWDDIPGYIGFGDKLVRLQLVDPETSNSGAMFVAAASIALNDGRVLSDGERVASIAADIVPAYRDLGQLPTSTNEALTDYQTKCMAGAPLVLGYESDFIVSYNKGPEGRLCDGAEKAMLYLSPGIMADHTFIQLKPSLPANADKRTLRDLLREDTEIQHLAAVRLGYRNTQHYYPDTEVPLRRNLTASPIPAACVLRGLIDEVRRELRLPVAERPAC